MVASHSDPTGQAFQMDSITSFGVLNALKTGDPKIDMIIALLMPLAMNFLITFGRQLLTKLKKAWDKWWGKEIRNKNYHERTITYRTQQNPQRGVSGVVSAEAEDVKNAVLLKAIRLYLHHTIDLNLKSADVDLTDSANSLQGIVRPPNYSRTVVGILSRYSIIKNPPSKEWHRLGLFGSTVANKQGTQVELMVENHETTNGNPSGGSSGGDEKGTVQVLKYQFRSLDGGAIDDFLLKAYDFYLHELRKAEDTKTRYYYDLQADDNSLGFNDVYNEQRMYTRFQLSSDKTFDSLFFPDKEPVLQLVDDFVNKNGKFKIKGYPHKLGILLHGPPGTGKTSFIKALAEYTNRNIVNVPLSKISSNADLTNIFFSKKFFVPDVGTTMNMDFKDVIFVMEDIDAASDVVKRRDGKKAKEVIQTANIQMPTPKSLWHMMLESEDDNCKKLVSRLSGMSERLRAEATKPEVIKAATKRATAFPALGLVGESEDKALQKLSADAIKSSQAVMNQISTVDKILGFHAKKIERLLDEGAEVNEEMVNELLGTEKPLFPAVMTREASNSQYGGSDKVQMEMHDLRQELGGLFKHPMMGGQMPPFANPGKNDEDKDARDSWRSPYSDFYKSKDSLNLSGILNVLDGVVDTPSRIVIMTFNHPEKLDPALIRPGRIDKKLYLGHMNAKTVFNMLEHCFETTVTNKQKMRIDRVMGGEPTSPKLKLTPAEVEQMASTAKTVDDMIAAMEEKATVTPLSVEDGAGSVFPRSQL